MKSCVGGVRTEVARKVAALGSHSWCLRDASCISVWSIVTHKCTDVVTAKATSNVRRRHVEREITRAMKMMIKRSHDRLRLRIHPLVRVDVVRDTTSYACELWHALSNISDERH